MTEEQIERWPLPRGWVWAAFEDVANIAQNLVLPKEVFDLPHIAPNHIGSGNRQLLPYTTVRADAVISPKQRFFPGQILFTKIRPYLLNRSLSISRAFVARTCTHSGPRIRQSRSIYSTG